MSGREGWEEWEGGIGGRGGRGGGRGGRGAMRGVGGAYAGKNPHICLEMGGGEMSLMVLVTPTWMSHYVK